MKNISLLATLGASTLLVACSSSPEMMVDGESMLDAKTVYTQTNLHPDVARKRLFSINYQQDGLIPRCSEVELVDVNSSQLLFNYEGQRYQYVFHKASGDFDTNLKKYFGTRCDDSALQSLSEIDRKGLKNGQVYEGMSKKGVTLAIGFPPQHVTPSLESNVWRYWNSRFNTFLVNFDENGKVESIKE